MKRACDDPASVLFLAHVKAALGPGCVKTPSDGIPLV
jgi:hypothetical protein